MVNREDNSLEFTPVLVKTCVGSTTSQPDTDQKPTELSKNAESKKVPPLFWSSRVFQKIGGEVRWNACVILRNIQDKLADIISPYDRRFGTPFNGSVMPVDAGIYFGPISTKDKKPSSSTSYKDGSTNFHRIRDEFWRSLDRRHDHRGLARHREQRRVRSSRQEIQVQRSRNQEIARSTFISLRRWLPETGRSRTTSNLKPPGSRELRRGGGRTLHFWAR